jgi:hypothetical protein
METINFSTFESQYDKITVLNSAEVAENNNEVLHNEDGRIPHVDPKVESSDVTSRSVELFDSYDETERHDKKLVIAKRTCPNYFGNTIQKLKSGLIHKLRLVKKPLILFGRFLQSSSVRALFDSSDSSSMSLTVAKTVKEFSQYSNIFFPALTPYFDKALSELLLSNDVYDFKNGIVNILERIGRSKLILAVLLYAIHSEWKIFKARYNFKSLIQIIDSLPDQYRMSRQSFHHAVCVGMVLTYYGVQCHGFFRINEPFPENEELVHCLYSNYSKTVLIAAWLKSRNFSYYPISNDELISHLRNDSVKAFREFIDAHIHEKILAKTLAKPIAKGKKQKKEKPVLPKLSQEERIICQEVAKGRFIYFLTSDPNDPLFVPSVKRALYAYYTERNRGFKASKIDIFDYAAELGFLSTDLVTSVKALYFSGTVSKIPLEFLQSILVRECRTLTELRIAQAIIVYRFVWDGCIGDVCRKESENRNLTGRQLAKKYLDLDDPTSKMLLRIGEGLRYLPALYEAGIDPLANGSLDKLANFERAHNKEGLKASIAAFKCCNTKEFRHFAKTGRIPDKSEDANKFILKGYKRAKPFLDKFEQMRSYGLEIFPVSLYSEDDVSLVNKITSEYLSKRELAINETMYPSVPLIPDLRDSQESDSFDADIFY